VGLAVSLGLAALSAWAAGTAEPLRRHLWMIAGLALLVALTVLAAPFYHRWYRRMRRPGDDDRGAVRTYPPPAPGEAWAGGEPILHFEKEGRGT
jgi:hypothetical protein